MGRGTTTKQSKRSQIKNCYVKLREDRAVIKAKSALRREEIELQKKLLERISADHSFLISEEYLRGGEGTRVKRPGSSSIEVLGKPCTPKDR